VAEQRHVLGAEEGRIVLNVAHSRGLTIVELLVGITIVGLLLGLGAPAMSTYLQNSKLASATASYYNGIQTARTEAIRRNVRTEFVLTNTSIAASDPANNALPAATGTNWIVRAASGGAYSLVEAKAGGDGSGSATTAIQVSSSASAIQFNGFGAAGGGPYQIDIRNPSAGTCGVYIRCKRITVSAGGQVAACDPAASAAAGDSRACPP
jgi:type IV fimbrial biogenesis protein FimT